MAKINNKTIIKSIFKLMGTKTGYMTIARINGLERLYAYNVEDLSILSDLVKTDAYDEADLLHIIKSDNSENAQKVKELIKSLKPTENLPDDDEYTCTKYVRIYPDGTGNWEKLLPNNISKEYQLIIKSAEYLVNNCDYYYDSTSMDQYLNEMLGHNWVTDKEFADAYLSYMRLA